jgi:hypothetical protein
MRSSCPGSGESSRPGEGAPHLLQPRPPHSQQSSKPVVGTIVAARRHRKQTSQQARGAPTRKSRSRSVAGSHGARRREQPLILAAVSSRLSVGAAQSRLAAGPPPGRRRAHSWARRGLRSSAGSPGPLGPGTGPLPARASAAGTPRPRRHASPAAGGPRAPAGIAGKRAAGGEPGPPTGRPYCSGGSGDRPGPQGTCRPARAPGPPAHGRRRGGAQLWAPTAGPL